MAGCENPGVADASARRAVAASRAVSAMRAAAASTASARDEVSAAVRAGERGGTLVRLAGPMASASSATVPANAVSGEVVVG